MGVLTLRLKHESSTKRRLDYQEKHFALHTEEFVTARGASLIELSEQRCMRYSQVHAVRLLFPPTPLGLAGSVISTPMASDITPPCSPLGRAVPDP